MIKKIIAITFFFLTLTFSVNASNNIEANIIAKDVYSQGEQIQFDFSIRSNVNSNIIYIPYIDCMEAPNTFLEKFNIKLNAGEEYNGRYQSSLIDETWVAQTCYAQLEIEQPEAMFIEKEFLIDALSPISLEINACRDRDCQNPTRIFYVNETINLAARVEPVSVKLYAKLIKLNESETIIELPYSYIGQEGIYRLVVSAKKDQHRNTQSEITFSVTPAPAKIKSVSACKPDGQCLFPETAQNCPQDCVVPAKPKTDPKATTLNKIIFLVIAMIIIIISIIMIYYFLIRKKREIKNEDINNI